MKIKDKVDEILFKDYLEEENTFQLLSWFEDEIAKKSKEKETEIKIRELIIDFLCERYALEDKRNLLADEIGYAEYKKRYDAVLKKIQGKK